MSDEHDKNREIYRKIKKSIDSMSEDEIRMLYDLCDDMEKDILNKIRDDKNV